MKMKVKNLIKLLKDIDQEAIIILSRDPEGNAFRPISCIESGLKYDRGEIGLAKLENGYTIDDVVEGGYPAVVLWPSEEP